MNKMKESILRGAYDIFSTKPFNDVRIEDITTAANCGKGTFYKYFASKTDCLCTLYKQMLDEIIYNLETIVSKSTPDKAIDALLEYYLNEIVNNKHIVRVFLYESVSLGSQFLELLILAKHEYTKLYYKAVKLYNPDANNETLELQTDLIFSMVVNFCYFNSIDDDVTISHFTKQLTYILNKCKI
jgi:AcrR family transcriptional regulator